MKVLLGLVVVILALATLPASSRANSSAVHIDGFTCGLLDGNGNGVITDRTKSVITSSGHDNETCKASVTPAAGGGAVHYDFASTGAGCGLTDGEVTDNWEETVSASGNATLSCHGN